MNQPTKMQDLQKPLSAPPVTIGFFTAEGFAQLNRVATMLSGSELVPLAYQYSKPIKNSDGKIMGWTEDKSAIANCAIALNMASRMGADPIMVMQNLYLVHGSPAWSSKFLIATINTCGRYSTIRYEWKGEPGKSDYGCRAWVIEKATGERLDGIWVTWEMVREEKWNSKPGSKWKTMPDQMFMYRAAAFWQRAYAPEIGMGLQTSEELHDTIDLVQDDAGTFTMDARPGPATPESLKAGGISAAKAADAAVSEPAAQQQAEPVQAEQRQPVEQAAGDGDLFASQEQPPAEQPAESTEPPRQRQRRQRDIE